MNRGQLVEAAAARSGVSLRQAEEVVTAALDIILSTISKGERVTLTNFGTFRGRTVPPLSRPNHMTGGMVHLPERRAFRFTPSVGVRKALTAGEEVTSSRRAGQA